MIDQKFLVFTIPLFCNICYILYNCNIHLYGKSREFATLIKNKLVSKKWTNGAPTPTIYSLIDKLLDKKFDGPISILDGVSAAPFGAISPLILYINKSPLLSSGLRHRLIDEAHSFHSILCAFRTSIRLAFSSLKVSPTDFLPFRGDTDRNGTLFFFRYLWARSWAFNSRWCALSATDQYKSCWDSKETISVFHNTIS